MTRKEFKLSKEVITRRTIDEIYMEEMYTQYCERILSVIDEDYNYDYESEYDDKLDFEVGDIVKVVRPYNNLEGKMCEIIGIEDGTIIVDFKFEYPGLHNCSSSLPEPLPKQTGLFLCEYFLEKVK